MEAHFAWWQESAGRQDAGMRSSKFDRPFSRAYSTHAAASTDTSALSANVARNAGLFVTFLPYSSTCGQSASQSSRGFLNVIPSASLSAYCVIANMNALPPASEVDANTFASLQRQLCVPRPIPCLPDVEPRYAETIHSSVR